MRRDSDLELQRRGRSDFDFDLGAHLSSHSAILRQSLRIRQQGKREFYQARRTALVWRSANWRGAVVLLVLSGIRMTSKRVSKRVYTHRQPVALSRRCHIDDVRVARSMMVLPVGCRW
jgi:hypothetical protein